jgi:hypothetical protein
MASRIRDGQKKDDKMPAASTAIRPQEGPQERFLSSNADICIYGGAAGG